MKLLTNRERDYSTNKLHADLNILKVDDIHKHCALKFVHGCVSGQTIPAFENFFMKVGVLQTIPTRNADNLITYRFSNNHGLTTTHNTGATLWNSLDTNIREIKNKHGFKKTLLKKYISNYTE